MTAATDTDLVALVDAVDLAAEARAAARMELGAALTADQATWEKRQSESAATYFAYLLAVEDLRLAARDAR